MTYSIEQTEGFAQWHANLRDLRAKLAIARRIERAAQGNLGDVKSLGQRLSELRIDLGAGYRVYFTFRSGCIIVLLAGGDKASQAADIRRARNLAEELHS
jgi:putative addiction module killer protein